MVEVGEGCYVLYEKGERFGVDGKIWDIGNWKWKGREDKGADLSAGDLRWLLRGYYLEKRC